MNTMRRWMQLTVPVLALALVLTGCGWLGWLPRARRRRACLQRFRAPRRFLWAKPLGVAALAIAVSGCGFFGLADVGGAVAQTSGLTYPIVDTNQTETYNNTSEIAAPSEGEAFYGQDAQIDGNQPSYVVNGIGDNGNSASAVASTESGETSIPRDDGTVTDLVTGLMWTQGYYGKMTYSEAVAMVDGFEYAGYSDWRLPSIKALYSLIDFSGEDINPQAGSANNPFVDTAYFDFEYGDTSASERIIDSQWVTTTLYTGSTEFAGGAQLMFGVNFADGRIKGYPIGEGAGPGGEEKTYFVRFVRGNMAYGENDFINNGDGTITDLATGLMWSQDDSGTIGTSAGVDSASNGGAMNWEEALAYVQQLNAQNYLGYFDWTLPNAKELQSIVDYDRSPDATNSAAIDPVFNVTSITNEAGQLDWGYYWTSTTHVSQRGGQAAVYIAFGRGLGTMNGQFMDVHGAGCQRSDPKTGSPSYGFGPQGDVVRVTNFVRVVRNAGSSSTTSSGSGDSPNSDAIATTETGNGAFASEQDESFILFAPLNGTTAYLINRDGDVVHDWEISGQPGNSVYLTEGGNLLATYGVRGSFQQGGVGGGVELLTWDGEEVWSFELATDHAHLHHDVDMLPNGNVLMISWEAKTSEEALAAGLSASQLPDSDEVWAEMILEYDPDLDQIVWEWHVWDHVLPEGWSASDHPEKIDLDAFANRRSEDWWHFNAVDYSAELDRIVVSSRAASEFWIIDHDLTTAEAAGDGGDLLYRWGNPAAYGASGGQILYGQHDAEWLDTNTILLFDNGDPREWPYSRVVELDLPEYLGNRENGLFEDATIVWSYGAAAGDEHFFSDHISGAQRLENGNTLICSGTEGRFFEVTPDGETVWEYVNPYSGTTPDGKTSNEVFRCEMYETDSPELEEIAADLSFAQVGASSAPVGSAQNVAVGEQSPSETETEKPESGPPGIASVSPAVLVAGSGEQMVTITLNEQRAPPTQVQFTRVAIGSIEATRWVRDGVIVRAWFDIPAQLHNGRYSLTITFPGCDGEPIAFGHPVVIR